VHVKRKIHTTFIFCALALSSCVTTTEAERERIDSEQKINWTCVDVNDSLANVIKKDNGLVRYDNALDNYARTGKYGDLGFNVEAPQDYFDAYEEAAIQFSEIKNDLVGPTLILDSALKDLIKIVQNPESAVSPMGKINTAKWNARSERINKLSAVVDALCQADETIRTDVVYSASSTCDLNCHFSQKSKIANVLVPDDAKGVKNQFDFWEFQTKVGSVSEISKFYLSTLTSKGWKLQLESKLDPTEDAETGFLVSQIWCRTSPTYLNLQLIVNDLVVRPGVTYISLGTDKDKSLGCN
jgi:hypothetical protein